MFKSFLVSIGPILVASVGLASCSSEKKSTDVYAAPAPIIKGRHGSQGLKSWDQLSQKTLELNDQIDMTEAAPRRVQILSKCRLDDSEFQAQFNFTGSKVIKLFQVIPEEILAQDLSRHKLACGFELNLFNEAGSNHIFNLTSVPITDAQQGIVSLRREGQPEKTPIKANLQQLEGLRVRYRNQGPAAVQVMCHDLEAFTLPFEQVAEMASFDWPQAQPRPQRPKTILTQNPLQHCRLVIVTNGQRQEISDIFQLIFPRQPFTVNIRMALAPQTVGTIHLQQNIGRAGDPLMVTKWEIANPDEVRRYVRIPKRPFSVHIKAFHDPMYQGNNPFSMTYDRKWMYVTPPIDAGAKHVSDDKYVTATLEPRQVIHVQFYFKAEAPINCFNTNAVNSHGYVFKSFEGVPIDDVTEAQHVIATQIMTAQESVHISQIPLVNIENLPKGLQPQACHWP